MGNTKELISKNSGIFTIFLVLVVSIVWIALSYYFINKKEDTFEEFLFERWYSIIPIFVLIGVVLFIYQSMINKKK